VNTHHASDAGSEQGETEYVTSLEAGLILHNAPDTVRALARRGTLAAAITTRAGRLFRRADVERLAAQRRQLAELRLTAAKTTGERSGDRSDGRAEHRGDRARRRSSTSRSRRPPGDSLNISAG
jgi:hypothetical protein